MAAKPATDKKTNNWPKISFETEYFTFEKKQVLVRCRNALKFEFLMSHDTSDSVKQVINPKKSIFQFDNANHKRNNDCYSIALLAQKFQTVFRNTVTTFWIF